MNAMMKKLTAMMLAGLLAVSCAACGGKTAEAAKPAEETKTEEPAAAAPEQKEETTAEKTEESAAEPAAEEAAEPASFQIAALKGPTAMGLVKLMDDAEKGETVNEYEFTLAAAADEVTPKLIKGELDMACVPANLAAVLYQKTSGSIEVLAVNTLGVIYIVENGDTIHSMEDLKGQTIVAAGKGSTPEYGLRYLLKENGIDPDKDVTIDWKSEHSECVAAMASGAATIALLPQPFVTVAGTKLPDLRVALDLTAEWDALENGSSMITGVIVARKDSVEASEAGVQEFLKDYAASVEWVNSNVADAAQLIGGLDIVAAPVAEKALPYCNIVCLTGSEMQEKLSGYLSVIHEQAPESTGGALPEADFYYGA